MTHEPANIQPPPLSLCYYADDFTGATDALEILETAGIRTVLFVNPPTAAQLKRYAGLQAVGVAGHTRSKPTPLLEDELRPALTALRSLGARHVHYKICSTFDSSPHIGSIGRAIEIGREVFSEAAVVPLVVGAPSLGRYCVFGNLFARFGIGSDGPIHRLDRHPATTSHPMTPADESDLRRCLARQTDVPACLFDVLMLDATDREATESIQRLVRAAAEETPGTRPIVLFDVLSADHLPRIGRLIEQLATSAPMFSVGSSGIEMALTAHWSLSGNIATPRSWQRSEAVDALLVVSGSCSPVTSGQISWAVDHGYAEIPLATAAVAGGDNIESHVNRVAEQALDGLASGKSVIVHTGRGYDDSRLAVPRNNVDVASAENGDVAARTETARRLGDALGQILKKCLRSNTLQRICVAGGDTSSAVIRVLGIESLEMLAPLSPGAPLCVARATGQSVDGKEMNFKGGQVGGPSYFELVRQGR